MSRFLAKPTAAPSQAVSNFNFTYTKLGAYENCPKKYYHLYVAKDVKEPDSPHLLLGNQVHAALAKAAELRTPLPDDLKKYQHHVDRTLKGVGDGCKLLIEQKLAMNRNFQPVPFFDSEVWFRGIVDVAKIAGDVAVVFDYKTGKPKEDMVQLALFAALVFSHNPAVQKITTAFVWLADDFLTTEDFRRDELPDLWSALLPRTDALENAHSTMEFPPSENALCKYCPVTKCAFNKRG